MSKVLIVEDESIIADDLKLMLLQQGFQVIAAVDNGEQALQIITSSSVDLILLDINIKGPLTGIDIARQVRSNFDLPFIFITSYYDNDTLKKVEEVRPNAFIAKPFKKEEVLINVRLALTKFWKAKPVKAVKSKIFIRESGYLKPVPDENIILAKGEDNYTKLLLSTGHEHMISHTLKIIEEKLPQHTFCRVHKSYIVNVDFIELIEGNSLQAAGHYVPIGKTYRDRLFSFLEVL